MKFLKNLLKKIEELILKIKGKDAVKLIEAKPDLEQKTVNSTNSQGILPEKDYLLMYKNIKQGILSTDDLMLNDLIKVMMIMNKEISILDRKQATKENEIQQFNSEIERLERENAMFGNILQNKA